MTQQFKNSVLKREESPYIIYQGLPSPDNKSTFVPHSSMQYCAELLERYDLILIGNHNFTNIPDSKELRILNLSSDRIGCWNFPVNGSMPEINFDYDLHVFDQVTKLCKDNEHTIYLECSLHPMLATIKNDQRASFLNANAETIAKGFLRMAVEVQRRYKFVAITTILHSTYSAFLVEEMKEIVRINEMLKLSALNLQLGVIDIAQLGVYTQENEQTDFHYRTDMQTVKPIFDFSGTLTEHGIKRIKDLIIEFEREKIMMLRHLNA